jgi:hypothetical protein
MSFENHHVEGNFRQLGFTPRGSAAMEVMIGTVKLTAMEHPFLGVALWFTSVAGRSATQFEITMPACASVEQIAGLIYVNFELVFRDQAEICKRYLEKFGSHLFQ